MGYRLVISRWLFWVGFEWAVMALLLFLGASYPLLWPLVVLVVGTRQHALAVLGHETVHCAIGVDYQTNDRLGNLLCLWPILSDVQGFRRFHIQHHQFVGTNLDPERQIRVPFLDRWTNLTPERKRTLILQDLAGMSIDEALSILRETRGKITWQRSVYCVGFACVVVACLGWAALLAWYLALVTSNLAAMRGRMWREHLGEEVTEVYVAKWWERALYLPHYIWRHEAHHRHGNWSTSCWDLARGD